jgi:hypothetical protein
MCWAEIGPTQSSSARPSQLGRPSPSIYIYIIIIYNIITLKKQKKKQKIQKKSKIILKNL